MTLTRITSDSNPQTPSLGFPRGNPNCNSSSFDPLTPSL